MGPGRDRAARVDPPTVDEDFADIRLEHAREDLDQRRLPGTVVAHQPEYLPGSRSRSTSTERLEATKRLRDASGPRTGEAVATSLPRRHRLQMMLYAFHDLSGPQEPAGPGGVNAGSPQTLAAAA